MYITNIDDIKDVKVFRCGKRLSDWLIEKNIPLLSIDKNRRYCFVDNELLREVLGNKPFFIF
jgi:hypothetical protein